MFQLAAGTILVLLNVALTVAADPLLVNQRAFADSLTSQLYSKENECSSAWGVSLALSLIYPTSVDESQQQMQTVLGFPTDNNVKSSLVWSEYIRRLEQSNQGDCIWVSNGDEDECELAEPTVAIANSVWFHNEYTLESNYAQVISSLAHQIDFLDPGAGGLVNDWVKTTTRGLIESVLPDESIDGDLVAVNSIYLKAQWDGFPFKEEMTSLDAFYPNVLRLASDNVAHFMHSVLDNALYSSVALTNYQLLRLPFTGDLSFIVALPLVENAAVATSTSVLAALPSLVSTRVALSIPKFSFESEYQKTLQTALIAMGMEAPFQGGLCPFSDSKCLQITDIIQKTFIELNEDGIEAAAATAIKIGKGLPPPLTPVLMTVDHPFQFFVYDAIEEIVLFEGRVGNPGIVEDAAEPQLRSSHSDDGFWMTNFGVDVASNQEPPVKESVTNSPSSAGFLRTCPITLLALTWGFYLALC